MGSRGMTYILSFVKVGTGVQTILTFFLRNFIDCNVGITDVISFKWDQVARYTYEVS
jgi:hypothetical protein